MIVGAEHVSFSAILTLAHGGARALAVTTELPRHQTLGAFRLGARARYGVPVWTRTRLSEIRGRERVEEVELTDLNSGRARSLECDTVVFSADWAPNTLCVVAVSSSTSDPRTIGGQGMRTRDPESSQTEPADGAEQATSPR